jgi:hypothetical protein
MRGFNISRKAQKIVKEEASALEQKYGNNIHGTQTGNVRFFSTNIENAVRDAGEELLRRARKIVRDGVISGESWGSVRQRVEQKYNKDNLAQRAKLIAQMELRNTIETIKLNKFNQSSDIIGVEVHNSDPSTPVTRSVSGTQAFFDEGEVSEQIAEQTDSSTMQKGFDPLPRTPPYHFNDTTTLQPIYKNEVNR